MYIFILLLETIADNFAIFTPVEGSKMFCCLPEIVKPNPYGGSAFLIQKINDYSFKVSPAIIVTGDCTSEDSMFW